MKKKPLKYVALLGIVLIVIGLYYLMIKAGIPYQDPTQEMIEQYNRDTGIGEGFMLIGLCIEGICVLGFLAGFMRKKSAERK